MLEKWPYANVEPKPGEHEMFSIAVSLKRIADALEASVPLVLPPAGRVEEPVQ